MTQRETWTWRHAILKSDLPPTTRHVLLTLSCHISDAGDACSPSIVQLQQETGLSKRAVIDHIGRAEISGWISAVKHGFKGRRWNRNEYRITVPGTIAHAELPPQGGERGAPLEPDEVQQVHHEEVQQVHHEEVQQVHHHMSLNLSSPYSPPNGGQCGFDRFWATWPTGHKVGKAACQRFWKRNNLEPLADKVLQGVAAWQRSDRWRRGYIANPSTFLSQLRWQREAWPPESQQALADAGKPQGCEVCGLPWVMERAGKRFCGTHNPDRAEVTA